jgi:hypothetical protein
VAWSRRYGCEDWGNELGGYGITSWQGKEQRVAWTRRSELGGQVEANGEDREKPVGRIWENDLRGYGKMRLVATYGDKERHI